MEAYQTVKSRKHNKNNSLEKLLQNSELIC